jgi:hypothetical protein
MALSMPNKIRQHQMEAAERKERRSSEWTPLRKRDLLEVGEYLSMVEGTGVKGWSTQVRDVWTNDWLVVTVHSVANSEMLHVTYRTALGAELGWKEKQRLKDQIFGPDRVAVEVYPRTAEIVDQANMYHLWVYPEGHSLGFGLSP